MKTIAAKPYTTPYLVQDNTDQPFGQLRIESNDGFFIVVAARDEQAHPLQVMPAPEAFATARFITTACNAHDDLLAACKAALEERGLREELSAIGCRSRERHHTAEAMRIDENRKREILTRINDNGRMLRAAIRKAGGEA